MNKINVLITGAGGQLARCLVDVLNKNSKAIEYTALSHQELSITDRVKINSYLSEKKYDYLINCAAFTDVAGAEHNEDGALLGNGYGPKILSECCSENNVKLIHISTDYVFGGSVLPVDEDSDTPNPLNRYGKTKLLGETEILDMATKTEFTEKELQYMIIRTSWLYSEYGNNFVKTILRKAKQDRDMNIVFDQVGSPTYAGDLAKFIVEYVILSGIEFTSGIYHFSNHGSISWYDFAHAICEIYNDVMVWHGGEACEVHYRINPITTNSLGPGVTRPRVVMLSKEKVLNIYNMNIPYWRDSLKNVIEKLAIDGDEEFNVR